MTLEGKIIFDNYFLQTILWIMINLIAKSIVFLIFYSNIELDYIGEYVLDYFNFTVMNELIFVIIFVPLTVNIFTFYIFDYLLKKDYSDKKRTKVLYSIDI